MKIKASNFASWALEYLFTVSGAFILFLALKALKRAIL